MWLLGFERKTSGRAVSALNHWAISPAPGTFIFTKTFYNNYPVALAILDYLQDFKASWWLFPITCRNSLCSEIAKALSWWHCCDLTCTAAPKCLPQMASRTPWEWQSRQMLSPSYTSTCHLHSTQSWVLCITSGGYGCYGSSCRAVLFRVMMRKVFWHAQARSRLL